MADKYHLKRDLTLSVQKFNLLNRYPESTVYIKDNLLCWKGFICPSSLSKQYQITVKYALKRRPIVILYDNCHELKNKNLPHVFSVNIDKHEVHICLHLFNEFNSSMLLSDTIIPWAQEWLYQYEIWLLTGTWNGGGHQGIKK